MKLTNAAIASLALDHFIKAGDEICVFGFYTKIFHKKRQPKLPFFCVLVCCLNSNHIFCLRTFLALSNSEFNFLAFGQSFEATALNGAVVNKYVRAAFTSDKTKTFCFVEELYVAGNSRHRLLS